MNALASKSLSGGLVASLLLWSAALPAAQSGAARRSPASYRIPTSVRTMLASPQVLQRTALLGLSKFVGDSRAIYVTSHRTLIAWAHTRARQNGGRYTPPSELLSDRVVITCGDEDIGETLDCARIAVSTPTQKSVPPISFASGPRTYRNAFGATWVVRTATAAYDARALRDGFVVTATEPGGSTWVLTVTGREAADDLLLDLDVDPPKQLTVNIDATANGWWITNRAPGYTWRDCRAAIGASVTSLAPLEPGMAVQAAYAAFQPPLTAQEMAGPAPQVECVVHGAWYAAATP